MRGPALALVTLVACNHEPTPPAFSSGPPLETSSSFTSTTDSTSSTSTTGTTGSTSASDSTSAPASSSSGAALPDAGVPPDFGSTQPEGCKGKIDFVFTISRLDNMAPEQASLLGSFDGFVTAIQEDFADFDSHILVANPDGDWTGTTCESYWCPDYGNCGPNGQDYVCGSTYDSLCDIELGAGLLFNAGSHATNHKCELAGGRRYIVTTEEPDLQEQFTCVASVGTSGPDTPMMKAIAAAVAPEINADKGCNAGFLRPDALLVIVTIMDTFDEGTQGSPQSPNVYFEKVIASKDGDTDAIVMVALLPWLDGPPVPGCYYEKPDGPVNRLRVFAEKFPHRVMGDICADSYAPALAKAATLVKATCSSFVPQ